MLKLKTGNNFIFWGRYVLFIGLLDTVSIIGAFIACKFSKNNEGVVIVLIFIVTCGRFTWRYIKKTVAKEMESSLSFATYSNMLNVSILIIALANSLFLIYYPWNIYITYTGSGGLSIIWIFYAVYCIALFLQFNKCRVWYSKNYRLKSRNENTEALSTSIKLKKDYKIRLRLPELKWKRIGIVLGLIIVLLAFLNPSVKQFEEFSADVRDVKTKVTYKRLFNGLVFSIYQKEYYRRLGYDLVLDNVEYYGFCLNFFYKSKY